ncbi:hypothetical protein J1614_004281 [Plenodomus biglobosus]|nr:hypothetical protein J1614_004281 [Plenodomus biglobosus]
MAPCLPEPKPRNYLYPFDFFAFAQSVFPFRGRPKKPKCSDLAPARISELAYTSISLLALVAFGSLKLRRIDIANRVEPQTTHTPTCAFLRVLSHWT